MARNETITAGNVQDCRQAAGAAHSTKSYLRLGLAVCWLDVFLLGVEVLADLSETTPCSSVTSSVASCRSEYARLI